MSERRQATPRGAPQQFLNVAIQLETDDCILWPYGTAKCGGYGRVGQNGLAHRMICEMAHGAPTFDDARACHSCGNAACVNKRHLRWGTAKDNASDAWALGELRTGDQHGATKLTDAQVFEIERIGHAKSIRVLAIEYGVSQASIEHIRAGRRACQRRQAAQ